MEHTSPVRSFRFDLSPLYRGDHETRCTLISNLIVMIGGFEPGSHQHDVIFRNLLELHPRILDAVRGECVRKIRRIQLDWPLCYSRSEVIQWHGSVAEKLRHHELVMMSLGERVDAGVYQARRMMLSPRGIVEAFDKAGWIVMN